MTDDGARIDSRRIATSAAWSAVSTAISAPVLIGTTIALAHILGPTGVGSIAVYTFVTALASGLIDIGITSALMRKAMLAAGADDQQALMRYVRAQTTWSLVQTPFVLGVGAVMLHRSDSVVLYSLGVLAAAVFVAPSHFLVVTSQLRVPSQVKTASVVLSSALTITTAAVSHRPDLTFAAAILGSNALTAANWVGVPRSTRRGIFRPGHLAIDRHDVIFGIGGILNGQLLTVVFSQSETLFFRGYQAVDRGRYAVSQTVAARSTLLLDSLLGPVSAGLTTALGRGEASLKRAFGLASDAIILLYLLTCPAGVAVVAALAEPVFGSAFHGIALFAVILTVASLLQTAAEPVAALYVAHRRILKLTIASTTGAAIDLGAAVIFIQRTGVDGAVAAASAGQVAYLALLVALAPGVTGERAAARRHMTRACVITTYCAVPGVVVLCLPDGVGAWLAAPIALVWTAIGLRLKPLRGGASIASIGEHLPGRVSGLLRSPRVARLFGESSQTKV